jgi:hypothetical protein
MLARKWRDSVLDAMRRRAAADPDSLVHRDELIRHELDQIVAETQSHGSTPDQTLSFVLQELREEGMIEFIDRGTYRLSESK